MSVVLTADAEFAVNSNTASNQKSPDFAALPDGGYVVVWGTLNTAQDSQ